MNTYAITPWSFTYMVSSDDFYLSFYHQSVCSANLICVIKRPSSFAGNEMPKLDWQARLKIAIGTAKGLRYLHEDCRVGCLIHKNLRPSNILLTHDFEPLVCSHKQVTVSLYIENLA